MNKINIIKMCKICNKNDALKMLELEIYWISLIYNIKNNKI